MTWRPKRRRNSAPASRARVMARCRMVSHSGTEDGILTPKSRQGERFCPGVLLRRDSDPAQVCGEERQGLGPGVTVGIRPVALAPPVHEGVASSGVGVELMHLAVPGQFSVEFAHIGG